MTTFIMSNAAMREMYPEIEPYRTQRIAVDARHTLRVEECGNPDGLPVIFLHGGPGAGLAAVSAVLDLYRAGVVAATMACQLMIAFHNMRWSPRFMSRCMGLKLNVTTCPRPTGMSRIAGCPIRFPSPQA